MTKAKRPKPCKACGAYPPGSTILPENVEEKAQRLLQRQRSPKSDKKG